MSLTGKGLWMPGPVRFDELRSELRDRARVYDAPGAYEAGVEDALDAVEVLLELGRWGEDPEATRSADGRGA